jgi:hypothetical protein
LTKNKAKDVEVDEVEDLVDEDVEEVEEDAVETVTASDVAALIGVHPKTFRRFMRARVTAKGGQVGVDTPGSGGRYAIPAAEVDDLVEAFAEWARPKVTKVKVVEVDDEDFEDDELIEEEFSDEADEVDEDDDTDEDEGEEIEEIS